MKINNIGTSGINPYKRQMNKIDQTSKSAASASDKIEISSAAKEMQQASSTTQARQAKIDDLKVQIENGNYKPNPKDIAKSIVSYYTKH
ncbi:flagellar biosynthesis anti-sigma factor FlgM [Cytobacillus gottheilii]|uniref:flagellar biosynthesis anti-sigma factor FlgM n=1 Tax=Cytobacillus gottheilii TaxID=859144 RepID=UPI0024946348|nr:flagellar biosynthesis anti-sigma factor FlgM [Cytobacillus gottheilii]